MSKRLSIKDVRSQEGGGCPVRAFCGQEGEGVLQMLMSALFGAKNIGFFEILVCTHGQGEVESVRTI